MSTGWQALAPDRFVGSDDKQGASTLTTNTIGNVVLSFRTRPGLAGWITSFGQAWDTTITPSFSLRINGAIQADYNGLAVQQASNGGGVDLPVPIRVEQLSLIEVVVDVASLAPNPETTGQFATRVVCKYFNP